ncbi:MAG: photosynthetic complex putative assembly protein PuhB [Rubrivivax sp.]
MSPATPRPTSPPVLLVHEFEPQHGLPQRLPAGERLLWQGTPRWTVLARRVFHVDWAAGYFALMLAWVFAATWQEQGDVLPALRALRWVGPLALAALAMLLGLAWLTARNTVYTITDRRVVMRIGIVLTVAYNLPLTRIDAADLRWLGRDGVGDLALTLEPATRIAWLHLWPHARPWHVRRTQPMLRALPDAAAVAALLTETWARANGTVAQPLAVDPPAAPSPRPALAAGH